MDKTIEFNKESNTATYGLIDDIDAIKKEIANVKHSIKDAEENDKVLAHKIVDAWENIEKISEDVKFTFEDLRNLDNSVYKLESKVFNLNIGLLIALIMVVVVAVAK